MIGKQNSKLEETHSNNPDEMIETFVNVEIYNELVKKKKKFLIRSIIFFVCFYFALELGIILAPKIMAKQIFYHFTVAWALAFLQFAMVWALGALYFFKAKQFDQLAEKSISRRHGL